MFVRTTAGLGVFCVLVLVGCSAKTDHSDSSDDDVTSASTAKEGQSCGGTVAHPKQCASGLACVMPTPHAIGGTGTCQKDDTAQEGESCEGTVANPKHCAAGLTCVMPTPHAIGGTGTCQKDHPTSDEALCKATGGTWDPDDPLDSGSPCICPGDGTMKSNFKSGVGCSKK
jgi:hypothetical protein